MLQLDGLKLSFVTPRGENRPILNISRRDFPATGFIGIKGPSGIGKTTLLNVLSLLEKPQEGHIYFENEDILALSRRQQSAFRKKHIGYLRQNAELLPHLSVLDNVLLPLSFASTSVKSKEKAKAKELLTRFGVNKLEKDFPSTLSGGEASRVALCRSLIGDPSILLCDEPTDALDEPEALRLMGYLKEVSNKALVLMVSHDEAILDRYCDSVLTLKDGDLQGKCDESGTEVAPKPTPKSRPLSFLALGGKRFLRTKAKKALTILISSFGFMGVALTLGFSNGATYLSEKTEEALSQRVPLTVPPLSITTQALLVDLHPETTLTDEPNVYVNHVKTGDVHFNVLRREFLSYLEANLSPDEYRLEEGVTASILRSDSDGTFSLFSAGAPGSGDLIGGYLSSFYGSTPALSPSPASYDALPDYYDCLSGDFPKGKDEVFFVVREDNYVNDSETRLLGLEEGTYSFHDVVGREFKFMPNDSLYTKRSLSKKVTARFIKSDTELKAMDLPASAIIPYSVSAAFAYQEGNLELAKSYIDKVDAMFGAEEERELFAYSPISNEATLKNLYDDASVGLKVRISGILRPKPSQFFAPMDYGVYYSQDLASYMKEQNKGSAIAKEIQSHLVFKKSDYTLSFPYTYSFLNEVKEKGGDDIMGAVQSLYDYFLYRASFGVDEVPNQIVFPFAKYQDAKRIINLLDAYNEGKEEWEKLAYTEPGYGYIETLQSYTSLINVTALAIFGVIAVAHVFIVTLFAFLDTKGRKREIGLYRSLGGSGPEVAGIFLSEGLFVGLGTTAVGLGLSGIAIALFNALIRGSIASVVIIGFVRLSFLDALLLVLSFVAVMLLATLSATLFYGLFKPASTLRQES